MENRTLEEKISFWNELHNLDNLDSSELSIETQFLLLTAKVLKNNSEAYKVFALTETDFDINKANELLDRLDRPTKLAEYLDIKFETNQKNKVEALLNALATKMLKDLFSN